MIILLSFQGSIFRLSTPRVSVGLEKMDVKGSSEREEISVHFKSSDKREKTFYQNWEVSIVWLLFLCIEVPWSVKCIVLLYYYSFTFMTMVLSFQGNIFGLSTPRVSVVSEKMDVKGSSVREGISVHEQHMCTSNLQTREKNFLSVLRGMHSMITIFMYWSTVKYEVHCFIILLLLAFYDNAAFFSRKYLWTFNSQSLSVQKRWT